MAKQVKIGFDIDDVALNYSQERQEVFEKLGGKTDTRKQKSYDSISFVKDDEKNILRMAFGYMMNKRISEVPGFNILLNLVSPSIENPALFITARTENLAKSAVDLSIGDLFSRWGYSKNAYGVDYVGFKNSKLDVIKSLGINVFFDDRRKTCMELSQNGVFCFMPAKPWNAIPDNFPNIFRYNSCQDAADYFKEYMT